MNQKKTRFGKFKSHAIELNEDDNDGKTVLKVEADHIDMTIAIGIDAAKNFEEAKKIAENQKKKDEENIFYENAYQSDSCENALSIDWLLEGYSCATSVCLIKRNFIDSNGKLQQKHGSGFLFCNEWIITNNHVIKNFQEAVISEFIFMREEKLLNLQSADKDDLKPLWTSSGDIIAKATNDQRFFHTSDEKLLDYSIIRINPISSQVLHSIQPTKNVNYGSLHHKRCNIIGHPSGDKKKIGIQKNFIVEVNNKFLLYTTDTEKGMSGSPIFDMGWNLIGVHHGSKPIPMFSKRKFSQWTCENEGIRMDVILEDLQNGNPQIYNAL